MRNPTTVTILSALTMSSTVGGPPTYVFTSLDPDLANFSVAWSVDDDSNIAGEGVVPCVPLWTKQGAGWTVASAAPDCEFQGFIIPAAIENGRIVGWGTSGAANVDAIAIEDETLTVLPAGSFALASDVNASGLIVGAMGMDTAFVSDGVTVTPLPAGSAAVSIMDDGTIVGADGDAAALWTEVGGKWVSTPLGIKAHSSLATHMNDAGLIAGVFRATAGGPQHPFLLDRGRMIDLGTLGGTHATVTGITAAGDVVGTSDLPFPPGGSRAFIWHDGVMYDMNDLAESPMLLRQAFGCNRQGQIVGEGQLGNSPSKAWVATPIVVGDLTVDARVNGADLAMVLAAWSACAECGGDACPADLDGNCVVDGEDLGIVIGAWSG